MSPRPYQPGKRRLAATSATRSKILSAARELLAGRDATAFSIDAVAERADVARMTVYYQFKSKGKLLEALFDDVGAQAQMSEMRDVMAQTDPIVAISMLVDIFCRLWRTQGPLVRRLHALAALDPEVQAALTERGSWRYEAIEKIVERLKRKEPTRDLVAMLHTLTSFETYDMLASLHKRPKQIVALLQRSAAILIASLAE